MPAAFKWTAEELQDIVNAYRQGESAQSIAKRYGTSYQVIQPVLIRQGVALRSPRESRKKRACNEHYFQVIDSEEKAYWLGFITADGCVTRGKNPGESPRITLHLGEQDYNHLVKLKRALRATQIVSKHGQSCSFTVFSSEMASDLAAHGILPMKTFSTKPAKVPPDLVRHYWRGVFDGDGHIKPDPLMLILVGDYDIVVDFQQFVLSCCPEVKATVRKTENIFAFAISKQASTRILRLLYGDATVYLDRKYDRAQQVMRHL